MDQKQGLIAILDALGAATYSDPEIATFLESRDRVLSLLRRKANSSEVRGDIEEELVSTFTFNDTVLIIYRTEDPATLEDVEHFSRLLRKFMVDSLARGILFRGSLSVGTFYVDDDTNTVMGPAVTDAAAWYSSADWIGINATPHATLAIQSLLAWIPTEGLLANGSTRIRPVMGDHPGRGLAVAVLNQGPTTRRSDQRW